MLKNYFKIAWRNLVKNKTLLLYQPSSACPSDWPAWPAHQPPFSTMSSVYEPRSPPGQASQIYRGRAAFSGEPAGSTDFRQRGYRRGGVACSGAFPEILDVTRFLFRRCGPSSTTRAKKASKEWIHGRPSTPTSWTFFPSPSWKATGPHGPSESRTPIVVGRSFR